MDKVIIKKPAREKIVIDATDQSVGRMATQIVMLLRGKNKANFDPARDTGNYVNVINASKVKFTGKKAGQKQYYHYSGYPGGLKIKKMSDLIVSNPSKIIFFAVHRMLPKNKLRAKFIKRLKITR